MIVHNIAIDEIKIYENNPRKNDQAVEGVKKSIKEFGFKVPMIITSDKVIIAGHTRLKAAQQLGYKEVPCVIADDLTEDQIRAFRIADNKTAETAEWDFELLKAELEGLEDMFTGFDEAEMQEMFGEEVEVEEDDYEIELPSEPRAKLGDIYKLGNHRLMCGDSTDKETVSKLMNGVKADMVFTDPPYGMKKENEGVLNDNLNYDDLLEFNKKWIPISLTSTKDNGSWYCWGIDEPLMDIYSNILKPKIRNQEIVFRNLITWFKNPSGLGDGQNNPLARSYGVITEKCLFVMCGVQGFNNNADNYFDGYEPIRKYLEQEAKKVELNDKKLKEICGVGMYSHWFTKSQWTFITEEHYKKLQEYYKDAFKREYDAFKREYDALKREYYSTRAYFQNEDESNNVWNIELLRNEVGRASCRERV